MPQVQSCAAVQHLQVAEQHLLAKPASIVYGNGSANMNVVAVDAACQSEYVQTAVVMVCEHVYYLALWKSL